jgi:hypothetical protein
MKFISTSCAVIAVCLAAHVALGATAILIEKAEVYKTPEQVADTLTAGTKVATGRVSGEWVEVSYTKNDEQQPRTGWVQRAYLEPIEEGYDATVSAHCVVHAQTPADAGRFNLKITEDLYNVVAGSLVNAQGEPPFAPNVKLRVYLLDKATYAPLAKQAGEPDDSVAFSPNLGSLYLDFSLHDTTTAMKGQIVHELARLVLFDYSRQPQGRPGAGAPLPLWLVEAFAVYHEFHAGFNTDDLLYVPDKPKLTMLINSDTLPRRFEDRRAYLATAGTLGHMLLNAGTKEQFSQLVRIVQTTGNRMKGDALLYEYYKMTRAGFNKEWEKYVDLLKEQHDIRRKEEEMRRNEENNRRDRDFGGFSQNQTPDDPVATARNRRLSDYIAAVLPSDFSRTERRAAIDRIISALNK